MTVNGYFNITNNTRCFNFGFKFYKFYSIKNKLVNAEPRRIKRSSNVICLFRQKVLLNQLTIRGYGHDE